jgi:hypothetical protein
VLNVLSTLTNLKKTILQTSFKSVWGLEFKSLGNVEVPVPPGILKISLRYPGTGTYLPAWQGIRGQYSLRTELL